MRIHPSPTGGCSGKKDLRRLPHVYSKVLELPLPADTDVAVFEGPEALHFVAAAGAMGTGVVRVRTVRIHPGVVKVVVQAGAGGSEEGDDDDDMELDKWRSRLPEASCPAVAVAGYVNGQLVVTVPKGVEAVKATTKTKTGFGGAAMEERLVEDLWLYSRTSGVIVSAWGNSVCALIVHLIYLVMSCHLCF